MKRAFFTTALVLILVSIVTYIAVLYAKGYRLDLSKGSKLIAGTGLLVLTSTPDGARVYIDDNLTTATDDTINLPPGNYEVKIEKDGYFSWNEKVTVKNEAVTKTEALLFPSAPKLEAVTLLGAQTPLVDPSGSLIAYTVNNSTPEQNGIYILSLNSRPILPIGSSTTQIASDSFDTFSKAQYEFSPDGKQLLVSVPRGKAGSASGSLNTVVYLLNTNGLNTSPKNVTVTQNQIRELWLTEKQTDEDKFVNGLPKKEKVLALANFSHMLISPERDKVMYVASVSAQMPFVINPPLPSTNSTPENRILKAGNVYVYQVKEDKNYLLYEPTDGQALPKFLWHPSSSHLLFIKDKKIQVVEFDGGNRQTLYSGPFDGEFLYPAPDGLSVIFRTNLNDESVPSNLYRLGLK